MTKHPKNDDVFDILNRPMQFVKPYGEQWIAVEMTPIESFIDDVTRTGTAEAGHNLAVILGLVDIDDDGDQDA